MIYLIIILAQENHRICQSKRATLSDLYYRPVSFHNNILTHNTNILILLRDKGYSIINKQGLL